MNRLEIKERAKSVVNANLGTCIIAYLVYMLVISFLSSTGIGGLVSGLISVGLAAGFLKMIRNGKAELEDFVGGVTENVGTKFIGTLLVVLYVWLWSLLFVIPGIIKSYSYAMTNYILLDRPELSATDAIEESKKMMEGHKMDLFILDLSFFGWYLLGSLTCGLLYFWITPYHMTSHAEFYLELKGNDEVVIEDPEIIIPQ